MRMSGTSQRPRLIVRRTLKNLSAQIIDDEKNATLFSLATFDKATKNEFVSAGNVKSAALFGEVCAKKAKEKGITRVVFDRAGYLYQGRIRAFAEALRKGGLEF